MSARSRRPSLCGVFGAESKMFCVALGPIDCLLFLFPKCLLFCILHLDPRSTWLLLRVDHEMDGEGSGCASGCPVPPVRLVKGRFLGIKLLLHLCQNPPGTFVWVYFWGLFCFIDLFALQILRGLDYGAHVLRLGIRSLVSPAFFLFPSRSSSCGSTV